MERNTAMWYQEEKKQLLIIKIIGLCTVKAPAKALWVNAVSSIGGDPVCEECQHNIIT